VTPRNERERLHGVWLDKLHAAEEKYHKALAQTGQLQAELPFLPPSDGNAALIHALDFQTRAMNEYARVLQTFSRLVLYGEIPAEDVGPQSAEPKTATDLDVQEWVFKHYGFVPHPGWIADCRQHLGGERVEPTHSCPADKRAAIQAALVALGIVPE
jgi:hypothetical protein